jgi:hypothetical protein
MNVGGADSVREGDFRAALRASLEDAGAVCAQEVRPQLAGWPNVEAGRLGGFDLAGVGADRTSYRYLVELKWCYRDKLGETLWDAFKISLASGLDGTHAGYVIAGTPVELWDKPADCAELFANETWSTRELISRYTTNWSWLLAEGSKSQPARLPKLMATELVASELLQLSGALWVIKAISVTPFGSETVEFENGWPDDQAADLTALPRENADTIRNLSGSAPPL